MKKVFSAILFIGSAVACQDMSTADCGVGCPDVQDIYAELETVDSKTGVDGNNNVLWDHDDQLVAFMKTTLPERYEIRPESAGTASGSFSKVETCQPDNGVIGSMELDNNVILYPYSDDAVCCKADDGSPEISYLLSVHIPEVQEYRISSFADASFPMVAVSDDNIFAFKNICGAVKFQIKGSVMLRSITLTGSNGELISGDAHVTAYAGGGLPVISMDPSASCEVSLVCDDGVKLSAVEPTSFIISIPPTEFKDGMSVNITDMNGNEFVFKNRSANVVKRSRMLKMPVMELGTIGVTGVGLEMTAVDLVVGSRFVLKPVFVPQYPSNTAVRWDSSDESVAVVVAGEITALKSGTATITVTTEDGGYSATCEVTVKESGSKPDNGGLEGTEDEDLNI